MSKSSDGCYFYCLEHTALWYVSLYLVAFVWPLYKKMLDSTYINFPKFIHDSATCQCMSCMNYIRYLLAERRAPPSDIPRTFSADMSSLRRKSVSDASGGVMVTSPVPPPPPTYPAPIAPDDDKSSQISNSSLGSRTGKVMRTNMLL